MDGLAIVSVPLSRFTPRVGGGSASFVRLQDAMIAQKPSRRFGYYTWIAVRFLLFACGGLVALSFGATHFILRIFDHDQHTVTPFLSLPIRLHPHL